MLVSFRCFHCLLIYGVLAGLGFRFSNWLYIGRSSSLFPFYSESSPEIGYLITGWLTTECYTYLASLWPVPLGWLEVLDWSCGRFLYLLLPCALDALPLFPLGYSHHNSSRGGAICSLGHLCILLGNSSYANHAGRVWCFTWAMRSSQWHWIPTWIWLTCPCPGHLCILLIAR